MSVPAHEIHRQSTIFPQRAIAARRGRVLAIAIALVAIIASRGVIAQPVDDAGGRVPPASDARLLRIFLTDGTSVVSFGEYARLGARVVFSMPLGSSVADQPALQLASLPADQVDWARTEAYAARARAAHYSATRGDEDYAELSSEVARTLNDIAGTADAATQLRMAEDVRRRVARWPADHYQHRGADVRQVVMMLDEIISELKAQTGQAFDLSFVSGVYEPPPPPLLPPPTLQESIQQTLTIARYAETPDDRVALLGSARALIAANDGALPGEWAATTATILDSEIAAERAADALYATLASGSLASAKRFGALADVRGLERLIRRVREEDSRYGQKRPAVVSTLVAALNDALDGARRLRLARDQWQLKLGSLRQYRDAVRGPLASLERLKSALEDIRLMAGPDALRLPGLDRQAVAAGLALHGVRPPEDLVQTHAVLVSAQQLAASAVRLRQAAVTTTTLATARDASAAAAGAMMLLDRARAEIERALKPPQP